ncbi:MAG: hypothetical protein ACPGU3_00235 [Litorivicinus sp.]
MNKALAGISATLMVFGMGLALWTHHEMQSRLAQESTTMLSANKAELYPAAMKSELEVARLSSNLGIVKAQGAEHLDELMLALDVAFSRHFLHSRGALYRPLMQQREYSTLMYQIGRHLELLENQIQRQDWSQAWVTQGDLSIAMNEVTRLSLAEQQARQTANSRELERFRKQCQTLNIMAWLLMISGAVIAVVGQVSRIRVSRGREYDLV